jgi:hypothetical protein
MYAGSLALVCCYSVAGAAVYVPEEVSNNAALPLVLPGDT